MTGSTSLLPVRPWEDPWVFRSPARSPSDPMNPRSEAGARNRHSMHPELVLFGLCLLILWVGFAG